MGVYRTATLLQPHNQSFPHACGGVPQLIEFTTKPTGFSPRMWGCTVSHQDDKHLYRVFPTHVGVYLYQKLTLIGNVGFPHACGGVPMGGQPTLKWRQFSPRMWGCTLASAIVHLIVCVFPTHVGVYRNIHSCAGAKRPFSPRMWGCTGHANTRRLAAIVFPTHVGVYLSPNCNFATSDRFPHACGGVPSGLVAFP